MQSKNKYDSDTWTGPCSRSTKINRGRKEGQLSYIIVTPHSARVFSILIPDMIFYLTAWMRLFLRLSVSASL